MNWAVWCHGVCVGMYLGWIIGAFTAIVCLRPRQKKDLLEPEPDKRAGTALKTE